MRPVEHELKGRLVVGKKTRRAKTWTVFRVEKVLVDGNRGEVFLMAYRPGFRSQEAAQEWADANQPAADA